MGDDIRALALEYNKAFGDGRLDRVAEMLHPDVEFDGTAKPTHGREAYMSGLPRLMRFAFQESGLVVKKIFSPSHMNQTGARRDVCPSFRIVAV